MRILIVSDAWHPQINGVVRTLETTTRELENMGHQVKVVGPDISSWRTVPAPTYPSVKLELFASARLRTTFESFAPDCVHIATEGPLGWSARNICLQTKRPFTTSYHTRFPEYLEELVPLGLRRTFKILAYMVLRRFHMPASAVMVATPSIEQELQKRKFRRIVRWSRGVDMDLFKPRDKKIPSYADLPRPILLYVGRVSHEKNLNAFLSLHKLKGTKVVIGDGPDLGALKYKYPETRFLGSMKGEKLAAHYAAADLFVFPSFTDTFGLVLLEAAASGLRIAALPTPGPRDIFSAPETKAFAVLDNDLGKAIRDALLLPDNPALPRAFAERYSWQACSQQFLQHLQAPTPEAVRRIMRLRHWLSRSWQGTLGSGV